MTKPATRPASRSSSTGGTSEATTRNEVVLVGRLAAPAEDRELPSGDVLTTWRLVVDRPPNRRKAPEGVRPPTVDALECVAWTAGVQRAAAGWQPGDLVSVEGALRRRFWRAPTGASSRYEVEVTRARRVARAA
jgi:single-strand DNA-binding protein